MTRDIVKLNELLNKYDKHEIEMEIPQYRYNADTNLKDTIREIHDNVAKEMYCKGIDDFIHECDKHCEFYSGKNKNITREDMLKIAERLKE